MTEECVLRIKTSVDLTETEIVRSGKLVQNVNGMSVSYREENAEVKIILSPQKAEVVRNGDYGLKLCLEEKKNTSGILEIGGNEGKVDVYTHEVFFGTSQGLTLIRLHYDLYFGKEKQEMKLRILIR